MRKQGVSWGDLSAANPKTDNYGVCSTPTVEGDRLYLVSPYAEVVCLDLNLMADVLRRRRRGRFRSPCFMAV